MEDEARAAPRPRGLMQRLKLGRPFLQAREAGGPGRLRRELRGGAGPVPQCPGSRKVNNWPEQAGRRILSPRAPLPSPSSPPPPPHFLQEPQKTFLPVANHSSGKDRAGLVGGPGGMAGFREWGAEIPREAARRSRDAVRPGPIPWGGGSPHT